jgi:hypothetical protein
MLTVLKDLGQVSTGKRNRHFYLVRCSYCGKEFSMRADTFKKSYSCGCIKAEIATRNVIKNHKHKQSRTRIYHEWQGIKDRCSNPNNSRYVNYGGRGIKMCDEWVNDFTAFRDWALAHGYSDNLTIERKDVNGDYEPSNCTYTSTYYQNRNRTTNIIIEGKCLTDWATEVGLNVGTVLARYRRGDRELIELLRPVWSRKRQYRDNQRN